MHLMLLSVAGLLIGLLLIWWGYGWPAPSIPTTPTIQSN